VDSRVSDALQSDYATRIFCSSHVLDEAERSLHDALCVLASTVKDSRVVWGGGWPEMLMAQQVDELARKTPGKKALAIGAFAEALRAIPSIISDNAGLDSAELVSELRAAHFDKDSRAGIDVITGTVCYTVLFSSG
jgi:T-complex protein 1 subunit beta